MQARLKTLLLTLGLLLAFAGASTHPSLARDSQEISKTPPVAIVASVSGDASIRYPNRDWQKCYALDLVGPETQIRTGVGGTVVIIFFYDDHREIVSPQGEARTGFRSLERMSGEVRRETSRSGGNEFDVPHAMGLRLVKSAFRPASDPDEAAREQDFVSAYVKVTAYPPVFVWRDTQALSYRLQLFNEKGEFIYETTVPKPPFKFPHKPPFRLIKGGLYYWQVLDDRDRVIVRKYGFKLLTQPQVKLLGQQEAECEGIQRRQKGEQASLTELFLMYSQYHTLDKLVHHLQAWRETEPDNPNVYRVLARLYLMKGCPLKAREALEQEVRLGQPDPVED